jgi:D-arabinose 1-dehydrogenase-like Zn-dependent alcohol dehydrogenase
MCAGLTIYGAIVKAGVPPGGSVGILGLGGLGHIGTQLAKVMGYTVLAVDAKQGAVDLANAAKHKPDVSMLATDDVAGVLEKLAGIDKDKRGYKGVDATILATDHPESFKLAAKLTKKHGKMVLVGQPADGITMDFHDLIFKDITLVGTLLGDVDQGRELMKLVDEEGITVHIKRWRIEQAEEMRQEYLSGTSKGKNVIVFD